MRLKKTWFFCVVSLSVILFASMTNAATESTTEDRVKLWLATAKEICSVVTSNSKLVADGKAEASLAFSGIWKPVFNLFGGIHTETSTRTGADAQLLQNLNEIQSKIVNQRERCLERFIPHLVNELRTQSKSPPPVIAIDSRGYSDLKGDENNDDLEDTNADEIERLLTEVGLYSSDEVMAVRARPVGWSPEIVTLMKPKLIFLHWSTFERKGVNDDCPVKTKKPKSLESCRRLILHLKQLIGITSAPIILYTREEDACKYAKLFFRNVQMDKSMARKISSRVFVVGMSEDGRAKSFKSTSSRSYIAGLAHKLAPPAKRPSFLDPPRKICRIRL